MSGKRQHTYPPYHGDCLIERDEFEKHPYAQVSDNNMSSAFRKCIDDLFRR